MKKKFLIGATVLLIVITTVISLITTSRGADNWYIEEDRTQGISWYYEVVDGEAVNVRTTGNTNAKRIKKLVVPATLGGYPVTKTSGEVGFLGAWIRNILGTTWDSLPLVEEVVLPEGLKVIGYDSFRKCVNLKKINLPSTLEKIEGFSFDEVVLDNLVITNPNLQLEDNVTINVKNLEIKDMETCNLNSRTGAIKVLESLKVEGVKNLIKCALCEPDAEVTISSDVETISRYAITGATDAYVDKIEDEVNLIDYTLKGSTGTVYHFKNIEKIKTNLPEGIKAIDVNKNEEFTVAKVGTGSDFTFKLEQEAGYNYENYAVYIEDVENYDVVEGKIGAVQRIDARFGEEYTIENVTGYKKIHVQLRKDILDLHLNQYIWGINDTKLNNSREPVAQIQEDRTISYQTNKNDLYVKYGDKIRYGIRVYNEGTKDGTANKIIVQIPEGLKLSQESEINTQYGWEISADGRTATTESLNDKTIKAYTLHNKVEYEEIFIDLDVEVLEESENKTLQTIARIIETSEEEEDPADNVDTETVITTKNETHPFDLILNKIDGIDNALLNGATFDLLDENKRLIKTGVTANGGVLNFGTVYAFGEQRTRYYIRETYTPEGYKNHLKYLIRLDVVPTYSDIAANNRVDFELDIQDIDVDTSKYETIEISTKEELIAIESNKEEKYVLTQDIDLGEGNWTPLNVENVKLDGQGHKITNLKIEGDSEANRKVGLFATYSGIIENLTLEGVDIDIKLHIDQNVEDKKTFLQEAFEPEETEEEIHAVGGIIGYSKDVILKNCKVTGTVSSETNNVGGLVGHSKEGTIAVFRNCINEANVSACYVYEHEYSYTYNHSVDEEKITKPDITKERLGNNAGGMIGTVLGPVYVTGCENNGEILAGMYNAGGMIGTAESKEYNTKNVFGQCDNSLNIYVKNERITGKYKITIKKVDETGNNLLTGAKFTVYDRNKNIIQGLENIELQNGILELPETINTIGTDTFYIKETEAPEGYVQLTDTYIKVEVEKTWNKEEQKYETETKCIALTESEMENDIAKSENTSNVSTGVSISNTDNNNVTLKADDVTIDQGSINRGSVYSGGINAGGFVGHTTCSVEVTDSKNEGEITSDFGHTAGVVGQILLPVDDKALLYVNNVENTGDILQEDSKFDNLKTREDDYYYFMVNNPEKVRTIDFDTTQHGAIAGIAAIVDSDVEIYNSKNTGKLLADAGGMSGIVGISHSDLLTIDNCENTGNLELSNQDNQTGSFPGNGGILGISFPCYDSRNELPREKSAHKITNCKNTGIFTINSHTGGIVGRGASKTLEISNCIVDNLTVNSKGYSDVGGIIGNSANITLNVNDNEINNLTVNMSDINDLTVNMSDINESKAYGSTGGVLGMACSRGDFIFDNQVVKINNCYVTDLNTVTNRSTAGIVGATNGTKDTEITNCNVNTVTSLIKGSDGASGQLAGILASTAYGSDLKVRNCNIDNCNFNNTISATDSGISGCIGNTGKNDGMNYLECTNIKVSNTNIVNSSSEISNLKNVAGIVAYASVKTIVLTNADLDNVKLESHSGNIGGIASVLNNSTQNITIDGCDSNKLTIDNIMSGVSSSSIASAAGIVLYPGAPNTIVRNCNIIDAELQGSSQLSGGIGWADKGSTISNVKLENSSITGIGDASGDSASFGTFNVAGLLTTGDNGVTMNNCLVKDCNISSTTNNTAGMVSSSQGSLIMTNCEVNNTTVENKFTRTDYTATAVGGMVSCANGITMTNCKTTNGSKVLSKCSNTGGLLGISNNGIAKFTKCSVDNTSIVTDKITGSQQDVGGIAGTIVGSSYLNECSVTGNTTINSVATSAAGLVGTAVNLYQCKDCKVEDVTINNGAGENYSQNTGVSGMMGYVYAYCDLENPTVKNVNLTTSSDSLSGIVAYSNFKNIKNADIENINLTHTNEIECSNTLGRGIAGIGAYKVGNDIKIESSIIKNINANIASGSIPYINAGGLFAYLGSGLSIDENTEISDINITNNTDGSTAGMIATHSSSNKLEIPNLEGFNNITVKGKQNTGGLVAYSYAGVEVGKLTSENITVEGENYVGGLFGMESESSYDWTIENVTLSNVNVTGKGNVGGILGGGISKSLTRETKFNNINISDLNVNNTGINYVVPKSPYRVNGYTYNNTGGIVGHAHYPIINNVTITGLNVTSTTTDGSTGGLVGLGEFNYDTTIADPDPTKPVKISGITINKLGDRTNTVTGNANYVGGLVGYSVALETTGEIVVNDTIVSNPNSGYSIGGIIGGVQEYSSAENIKLSNVTASGPQNSYAGGITGVIFKTDCDLKNIEANGITVKALYNVGGLVGCLPNAKLHNISVDGLEISNSYNSMGGIIGYTNKLETTGTIEVKNAELTQTEENSMGRVGGIIGNTQQYSTIKDITLENVKITAKAEAGGIAAGIYQTSANISDITVNNLEIITTHTDDYKNTSGRMVYTGYCTVGGLVGIIPNATMDNVNIDGLNIDNGKGNSGGLIAIVTNYTTSPITDTTTVSNSNFSNIIVKGRTSNSTQAKIGGLLGFVTHPIISDITINNIEVEDTEETLSTTANTGTLVGLITKASSLMSDSTVESLGEFSDITIGTTGNKRNKLKSIVSGSYAGVLTTSGKVIASNIEVNNMDAIGKSLGIVTVSLTGSELENITLNNSTFTGSNGQSVAGIVAIAQATKLSSCTINNSTINGTSNQTNAGIVGIYSQDSLTECKIIDCNSNNTTINATGVQAVGEIVGITNAPIENCHTNKGNISTNNSSYAGYAGGIVGIAGNNGTITDCTVTNNTSIKSTTTGCILGGIAGLGNRNIAKCTVTDATVENAGSISGGIAGYFVPTVVTENKIDDCNVENTAISSTGRGMYEYTGGIVGISNGPVVNSNFSEGTITSLGENVGGIAGMISNTNPSAATSTKLSNCNVIKTSVEGKTNHIGGIVGFSNNTIEGATITDSEVKGTGENSSAVGGILGHGSNFSGSDASIFDSKVICTNVTGVNQVGGISGGAVTKIENCYVGGKENETYETGTYAVEIKGKSAVGGIIGDAGIILADTQQMLTMTGTTINDSLIEGKENVDELIGIHNSFDETYTTGTQTESITTSEAINCTKNIVTE